VRFGRGRPQGRGNAPGRIISVLVQDGLLKSAPHDLWFGAVDCLVTHVIAHFIHT